MTARSSKELQAAAKSGLRKVRRLTTKLAGRGKKRQRTLGK